MQKTLRLQLPKMRAQKLTNQMLKESGFVPPVAPPEKKMLIFAPIAAINSATILKNLASHKVSKPQGMKRIKRSASFAQ